MENNDIDTEQVITTVSAPASIKRINIYAVFGISIFTTVLAAAVIAVSTLVISQNDSYYNEFSTLVSLACFILVTVLTLGIPALVGMKFGWRTVVTAIIMEAVLIFIVALGFAIFGSTEQSPSYDFSDNINSGLNIAD